MLRLYISTKVGQVVAFLSRHLRGGHGSALPGLVVEKLCPSFLATVLGDLPRGVVVVSGTNGKTTTTKMVAELLRANGLKVFTNPSGSNFVRGVISAALTEMHGAKLDADIAVLELDEVYATHFVKQVKPRYSLLLNVLRDQLDRFGEIDKTAELLAKVARATTDTVVLNKDDPRLRRVADHTRAKTEWFGYKGTAASYYKTDEETHAKKQVRSLVSYPGEVTLNDLQNGTATYELGSKLYRVNLKLFGIHNALNGAAALALVRTVLGDKAKDELLVRQLAEVKPAFGRGEEVIVGDRRVRLILVKNPSGFQLSLASVDAKPTMIAINDAYADGRDVSWLYDVDFSSLFNVKRGVSVVGVRAYDMALRLAYADIPLNRVNDDLSSAVDDFLADSTGQDAQIFTTYTAMLKIRDLLKKKVKNG